jgi:AcrR family transcriptional regulator
VDVILSAAKILVVRHGADKFTTNGVARLAGVSIGSLYQYFPSKRALLTELRKRHQEEGERTFRAEAAALIGKPMDVVLRRLIEQMLAAHVDEPELQRALELEGRKSWLGEWEARAVGIVRKWLELNRAQLIVQDLDQAAFMVMLTAESVTHGAVIVRPELLSDPTLVDGVVRMLLAYLTGSPTLPAR